MPTYDYQCTECGSVFEEFQSIKAKPLRQSMCETCGEKRPVRRLIGTGGAVIFKGSGFYQTDYRDDSYHKAAKADTDTQSKPDGKGDGKSGDKAGKPAAASEATGGTAKPGASKSSQASNKAVSKSKGEGSS